MLAAALVFISTTVVEPPPIEDDLPAFEAWVKANPVGELEAYLAKHELNGVVPTRQLVRTASDWRKCGGPQFEIPPKAHWPAIRKVLALVAELKQRKILLEFEAVSNYRNPVLNACAGGAQRSSHTRSFAMDLRPIEGRIDENALCNFWRSHGHKWDMGLSKYPSGRVHVDTSGYRTWGASHGSESTFCPVYIP
ncbi:MAG: peptidase M15 [Burkholderiales bacterium]|nr:peptidase M15 [Burkholderiales bacterium]